MSRIATLTRVLLTDWLRNREAVFFALLFPVILLVIFSTVFAGGAGEFTVHVQNNDRVDGAAPDLSATFVESLNDTDAVRVRSLAPDRDVRAWSRTDAPSGTVRVLVIPDGFAERVRAQSAAVRLSVTADTIEQFGADGNGPSDDDLAALERAQNATNATGSVPVTLYTASDDQAAGAVRGIVDSVVSRFNDQAIGVEEPPATVATADLGDRDVDAVDYFLPALLAAVLLINGTITMTATVAGYNANGTLDRLVATPLRRREWIVANLLHQVVLALAVTAVMLAVAHLLFGVSAVPGPLAIALIVLGAVGFGAIGMALGSFVEDADVATTVGNAIAFPLMFLSGVFWEVDLMPPFLQDVALLSPLYHLHGGLRQLMIEGTTEGTLVPFAVAGTTAVVFVALAVRVTRWHDRG